MKRNTSSKKTPHMLLYSNRPLARITVQGLSIHASFAAIQLALSQDQKVYIYIFSIPSPCHIQQKSLASSAPRLAKSALSVSIAGLCTRTLPSICALAKYRDASSKATDFFLHKNQLTATRKHETRPVGSNDL